MKISHPLLDKAAAITAVGTLRTLYGSCREQKPHFDPAYSPFPGPEPTRAIFCVWHDNLLHACFLGGKKRASTVVSRHRDGNILAEAMTRIGIQPVRGSSSKGGTEALRHLLRAAEERDVVVTSDGPRGPEHKAKPGIIYLASRSGLPVVPTDIRAEREWRPQGSWTKMFLPKPFSRIRGAVGEPLWVPPKIGRAEVGDYLAELETRMGELRTANLDTPFDAEFVFPAGRNETATQAATEVRQAA